MVGISQIKQTTYLFNEYKKIGNRGLKVLHDKFSINEFVNYELNPKPIKKNGFNFEFLGLKFKIKLEIDYKEEMNSLDSGQLNSYLVKKDDNELLLSFQYDQRGNVMQLNTTLIDESFPEILFTHFFDELIKYSNRDDINIKFQLK